MAILIQRGLPCPFCSSSDAYAEYDTNFYCFSCKASKSKAFKNRTVTKVQVDGLPSDCTEELPIEVQAKLYQHHFTDELIQKAGLLYSESGRIYSQRLRKEVNVGPRLILPYYENNELQYWEGKTCGHSRLKYITSGGKQQLYKTFCGAVPQIVIVEDILSAIRVGETTPCVALRGTSCNTNKLHQLSQCANDFIIWLDSDRPGIEAAKKLGNKLTWVGKVCYIKTKEDPKCYSDKEIANFINEAKHG